MSDQGPSLAELRQQAEAAAKILAEAEAAHAARPGLTQDQALNAYEEAMMRYKRASTDRERYDIANELLTYLENGRVKGTIIDRLAQLVVDVRGE